MTHRPPSAATAWADGRNQESFRLTSVRRRRKGRAALRRLGRQIAGFLLPSAIALNEDARRRPTQSRGALRL